MEILSEATNVIAEGEVLQLMNMHDASLDEAGYLRVIRSKTAKLFEASARLGAVLAGSPLEVEENCATYGQALGTAFQIIDDVLDYDGDATEMGKNLGDDLREGKSTLPLIAAKVLTDVVLYLVSFVVQREFVFAARSGRREHGHHKVRASGEGAQVPRAEAQLFDQPSGSDISLQGFDLVPPAQAKAQHEAATGSEVAPERAQRLHVRPLR